ncbi:MAG: DUF4340 domain-containing protein [Ignavibacteriales bacterium]
MKFYRNLIILSVVLLALVITYAFLPKKDETEKELGTPNSNLTIKTFKNEDVKEISLKNFSGTIVLTKIGKDWKMTRPRDYQLDNVYVTSFTKNIFNFKAMDIIDEKPSDLSIYGLNSPDAVLTVKTKNGTSTNFKLGTKLPTENGYYLMTSDSAVVYSINNFSAGDLLRTTGEFRDKTIFAFNKKDVAYLAISQKGKVLFRFNKNKNNWDVVNDVNKIAVAGDKKKIENIIDKLSSLKIKEFLNPITVDKEEVIGSSVSYTITIGIDKKPELKLIVGKDKDEASTYAEKESLDEVFALYKGDVDFVHSKAEEFMKK